MNNLLEIYFYFLPLCLMSSHQDILCEPRYFSLSQELISAWQLIKGIMELSLAAHSIAPKGSIFFPNKQIPFRLSEIGINFQQIVHRLRRRLGTTTGRAFYVMKFAKRRRFLPTKKIWRSYKLSTPNKWNCFRPTTSSQRTSSRQSWQTSQRP